MSKNIQGKEVTHRNKNYIDGIKFHKDKNGDIFYFSDTYNRWMPSTFTPIDSLAAI